MSTTKTEPQETAEAALARIRSGFSGNDVAAIMAFAMRGVDPDDIEPRGNVLTFKAWKAAGRQVARGATSVPVVVWIPRKGKGVVDKTEDNPDGTTPARAGMMRRTARLFHVSQTIELGAPKGTKPAAWWNPNLVKPGTYEVAEDDREQIETLLAEMREQVATAEREAAEAAEAASTLIEESEDEEPTCEEHGSPLNEFARCDECQATENVIPPESLLCTCPAVGIVTNVDCPTHGPLAVARTLAGC